MNIKSSIPVVIALAVGLVAASNIETAFAQIPSAADTRKSLFIFVVDDNDDGSVSEQVKVGITLPDPSGLRDNLLKYNIKVIPFGGIVNIADIESTTLPAIRAIPEYHDVPIIFYYPLDMKGQFTELLKAHFNGEMASLQNGWTDIPHGVSFANNVGDIFHEGSHLALCGTWHDQYGRVFPDGHVERYVGSNAFAWCN